MPQTAPKEGKKDRKKKRERRKRRNGRKRGSGRGRREVWKCFREGKKRPLREYMLMQNPFARLVLQRRAVRIPICELHNYSVINLCGSADHTGDFMVIKLQLKSGSSPSEYKQLCLTHTQIKAGRFFFLTKKVCATHGRQKLSMTYCFIFKMSPRKRFNREEE